MIKQMVSVLEQRLNDAPCAQLLTAFALRFAAAADQVDGLWQMLHMLQGEPALQDVGIPLIQFAKGVPPRRQAVVQQEAE